MKFRPTAAQITQHNRWVAMNTHWVKVPLSKVLWAWLQTYGLILFGMGPVLAYMGLMIYGGWRERHPQAAAFLDRISPEALCVAMGIVLFLAMKLGHLIGRLIPPLVQF